MSNFYVALLLAGLVTLAHCQDDAGYSEEEIHHTHSDENLAFLPYNKIAPTFSPYMKIAPGNADFALRLLKAVTSTNALNNVVLSPLTISASFAMLSLGAKGKTLSQLLTGLGFNQTDCGEREVREGFRHLLRLLNSPNAEINLNIGNALFIDEKFKALQRFLVYSQRYYDAAISQANFARPEEAEHQINSYIHNKTHGKLVDVVKGVDPNSVMILLSYIFLQANWEKPFNYLNTRDHDFFVDEHTTVKVPMMSRDGVFNYYRDTTLSCEVVQLFYKGGASAIFVLPEPGKMKQLENALNRNVFLKWLNLLKPRRTHLYLPKLTLSEKYVLKGFMRHLGIYDVFTDNADLSGIARSRNLKVSKAIHQAYLNVHENGTEAAAVTVIEVVPISLPPVLKLKHPFLFFIYEPTSSTILFEGKIINPKEN